MVAFPCFEVITGQWASPDVQKSTSIFRQMPPSELPIYYSESGTSLLWMEMGAIRISKMSTGQNSFTHNYGNKNIKRGRQIVLDIKPPETEALVRRELQLIVNLTLSTVKSSGYSFLVWKAISKRRGYSIKYVHQSESRLCKKKSEMPKFMSSPSPHSVFQSAKYPQMSAQV